MASGDNRRLSEVKELCRRSGVPIQALHDVTAANTKPAYHNNQHCFIVALNAGEGADFYELSPRQKRQLILAGLYHDYNHTGDPTVDDNVNIERAVEGFRSFASDEDRRAVLTHRDIQEVETLIRSTLHPNNQRPVSLSEKIIRDADMMEWFEPDAVELLEGLNAELKPEEPFTMASTEQFLRKHSFFTDWGAAKFRKAFPHPDFA